MTLDPLKRNVTCMLSAYLFGLDKYLTMYIHVLRVNVYIDIGNFFLLFYFFYSFEFVFLSELNIKMTYFRIVLNLFLNICKEFKIL